MTPNLRTHLAYPDAQLIHLHGLICAAHALPLLRIIAKPSLSASVEEGKQEGTDQKPRSQFAPAMEWSPGWGGSTLEEQEMNSRNAILRQYPGAIRLFEAEMREERKKREG